MLAPISLSNSFVAFRCRVEEGWGAALGLGFNSLGFRGLGLKGFRVMGLGVRDFGFRVEDLGG